MHNLLSEVDEVVCLVDEEELQRRAPQVVSPQMDLSELRQRPLEIISDPCRRQIIIHMPQSPINNREVSVSELRVSHLPPSPLSRCCRRRSTGDGW